MKRTPSILRIAVFILVSGLLGCTTPREEMYMLYGPMRPGDLSETIRQLDSMGIDYEVRSGNQIYISKAAAEQIQTGYERRLSEMNAEVSISTEED